MGRKRKYTDEQLILAVKESKSYKQVLERVGLSGNGSRSNIRIHIASLNLDTSHFTGQAWNKDNYMDDKLEDYLSNKLPIKSHRLKNILIRRGIFNRECSICKTKEWMGEPVPIHLDHINGNHEDNSLKNIRILCPNCHAQTPTYCRRKDTIIHLCKCGNKKSSPRYGKCINCYNESRKSKSSKCPSDDWRRRERPNNRKVERPSIDELKELINNNTWCAIGKMFGVSDNAVRKWAKKYELIS